MRLDEGLGHTIIFSCSDQCSEFASCVKGLRQAVGMGFRLARTKGNSHKAADLVHAGRCDKIGVQIPEIATLITDIALWKSAKRDGFGIEHVLRHFQCDDLRPQ